MSDWRISDGTFELGDVEVQHGGTITDARLVWQAHGQLNPARENVMVYPCSYAATHEDLAWLIGPDGARPQPVVRGGPGHVLQRAVLRRRADDD